MPITTPQELREHLELAIAVELSTVPPYLYAMYSIDDQTSDAALLIRSIAAEEMLHAALAANLLLAVGGDPDFSSAALIPTYPSDLPHHRPRLTLNLKPCSQQQVEELFLVIEQPELHTTLPDDDVYETLGQFYHAVERGFATVARDHDLFADPQADRQLANAAYYRPVAFDAEDSGGLGLVRDIEGANEAIHVIVHQGEGLSDEKWADPAHEELTHYYKFLQIADGAAPLGGVAPAPVNPRGVDYPAPVKAVSDVFNAAYRYLFLTMHEMFQPGPTKDAVVGELYAVMSNVLSPLAHHLMRTPIGDGRVAGPTFEVYEFGDDEPREHLSALATAVAAAEPALQSVADSLATM